MNEIEKRVDATLQQQKRFVDDVCQEMALGAREYLSNNHLQDIYEAVELAWEKAIAEFDEHVAYQFG